MKNQFETPSKKLEIMEKNLLLIYNLLYKWMEYIAFVKMSNS